MARNMSIGSFPNSFDIIQKNQYGPVNIGILQVASKILFLEDSEFTDINDGHQKQPLMTLKCRYYNQIYLSICT